MDGWVVLPFSFSLPSLIISSPPHYWFWLEGATICFCVSIVFWGSGGGGGEEWLKDAPGNTIYSCHSSFFPIIFAQSLHCHLPSTSTTHIHTYPILLSFFFCLFYFVIQQTLIARLNLNSTLSSCAFLFHPISLFTSSVCSSRFKHHLSIFMGFFCFVLLFPCSFSISNHLWLPVFFCFSCLSMVRNHQFIFSWQRKTNDPAIFLVYFLVKLAVCNAESLPLWVTYPHPSLTSQRLSGCDI